MESVTVLWMYVQWLLETHGWKLLGSAILFYVGRQRYREFKTHRHHKQMLAAANGAFQAQ
ncbi:uncharacterized protein PHALS_14949 [Plasmopara halstedii]|uniref:Uncharacterized protein n=1 Tax=Plasmopara halstedii TaxID=4781 RepID=A0A0P1AZC9_PLAHL|nr:uncharacterized protein PHALS_14949 [Plasmopara halstedii]CEG46965.1 hypothetical protein PHALS_14949 [Plasmopara halstedii]|eukprot:XP_024583334.1 hypothetical protein PHALS_14949 [Plasmopara halstedii]